MIKFAYTLLFSVLYLTSFAQKNKFETVEYYSDDTTKLALDMYMPTSTSAKTPLFIFMHGGAFSQGDRSSGKNICEFLAQNGIASASISYTLYMKDKEFSCNGIVAEKMKAIQLTSNQLLLATQYLIDQQEKYNIDASKIFVCGSSAGAETLLQTVFGSRDLMRFYPLKLPTSFKFAGLISAAGALTDINDVNNDTKIPSLFFHGTCDDRVPYATASHHYCKADASGWMMMFGAYTIHNKLVNELNGTSYLVSYCGGGHEYASKPFNEEKETILWFITHTLLNEKFQNHRIVPTNKKCENTNAFKFCD
jgi:predicted peptidase